MRKGSAVPTAVELQILAVLWRRPDSSVRDIHRELRGTRKVSYSTVATQMEVLHRKGLVRANDSSWPTRYAAAKSEVRTKKGIVRELIERVFGGSAQAMVLHAIGSGPAARKDLQAIHRALRKKRENR